MTTIRIATLSSVLLSQAIACRSPALATVGSPLVPGVVEALEAQRTMPKYLVPSDSLTSLLLSSFANERGIVLGRPDSALHCPWSGRTPTGYSVSISFDSISHDEARGRFQLTCSSPALRGAFATGGVAHLRRVGTRWVLDKWLDRWIT